MSLIKITGKVITKLALAAVSASHVLQISHQRVPQSQTTLVHVDIPEHQAMQVSSQNCQVAVNDFVINCLGLFTSTVLGCRKKYTLLVKKKV